MLTRLKSVLVFAVVYGLLPPGYAFILALVAAGTSLRLKHR